MKSNFMLRKQKQKERSSKASEFRISSYSIRISSENFALNKSHEASGNFYQNVSTLS